MLFNRKTKNVVQFCIKEGNSYNVFKSMVIKETIDKIKYADKSFIIDIENPSYRKRNVKYFCIDVNSQQIYFEKLESKDFMSPRLTNMIMEDSIVEQLAKAVTIEPIRKFDYVSLFVGILIGFMGGILIGVLIGVYLPFSVGV